VKRARTNRLKVDTVVNHVDYVGGKHKFLILGGNLDTNEVYGRIEVGVADDKAHIEWVEVKPEYRRKGVASAMYERLDRWAKEEGFRVVGGMQTEEGAAFVQARRKRVKSNRPKKNPSRLRALSKLTRV
jgi:GNAT superfamily N-acetyltransferase